MMSPERALIELIKSTNGKMEFIDKVPLNVSIKKLKQLSSDYSSKRVQSLVNNLINDNSSYKGYIPLKSY